MPMWRQLALAIAMLGSVAVGGEVPPDWLKQPTLSGERAQAPGGPARDKELPPNLVPNGDFEEGEGKQPASWSLLDGLTTSWIAGGPVRGGKCLRVDTDVYLKEWEGHLKAMAEGAPATGRKTPTSGPKYDTVAGTNGVSITSAPIRIQEGDTFRFSAAVRGPSTDFFYPKIFVKGYRLIRGEMREIWRGPLHCRCDPQKWQTFGWNSTKSPGRLGVQELRVVIYCYWPPGAYEIDDVRLWKVDAPTGPANELPPSPEDEAPAPAPPAASR